MDSAGGTNTIWLRKSYGSTTLQTTVMRAKIYHPTCEEYTSCLQRGGLPVYSGTVMQRGYGIGGIFKGLSSFLITLLPSLGKAVAKTAIRVVNDRMSGVPPFTIHKET